MFGTDNQPNALDIVEQKNMLRNPRYKQPHPRYKQHDQFQDELADYDYEPSYYDDIIDFKNPYDVYPNKNHYNTYQDKNPYEKHLRREKKRLETKKRKAWLSCQLTLEDFIIKKQIFIITGSINVLYHEDVENLCEKLADIYSVANNSRYQNLLDTVDVFIRKIRRQTDNIQMINIWDDTKRVDGIIKIYDLRDCNGVSLYDLPINPDQIFHPQSVHTMQHVQPPCMYYSINRNVVRIRYSIKAGLFENLELFSFPFDRQLLNIKIKWNFVKFGLYHHFKDKGEAFNKLFDDKNNANAVEETLLKEYLYMDPIHIAIRESIATEIIMQPPLFDFRDPIEKANETLGKQDGKILGTKQKENTDLTLINHAAHLHYGLIRLRITRKPTYYIFNILLPLFCITCSGFGIFFLQQTDVSGRLGLSIAILLTFTFFQSAVDAHLPSVSFMLLIDWYIFAAYLIQMILILFSGIAGTIADEYDVDFIEKFDWIFGMILGITWIVFSLFYWSLTFETSNNFWYNGFKKINCCNKCVGSLADWKTRAHKELVNWSKHKVHRIQNDHGHKERFYYRTTKT
eukprot:115326_1